MDEAEASDALQAAVDGVSDGCEQLLVCLRKQDQVRAAAPWHVVGWCLRVEKRLYLCRSNRNLGTSAGIIIYRLPSPTGDLGAVVILDVCDIVQVAQAAALGFEACDGRLRDAVREALRVAVAIELEAATKRLEVRREKKKTCYAKRCN